MNTTRQIRQIYLVLLCVGIVSGPASGQTARVQFVNASTYEEADTIDVYINGRLVLDDLAWKSGTPFRDYPASVPLKIEVKRGGAAEDAPALYSETLTLTPDERYFAIAAGDPEKRTGHPPFKFFVRPGAPEGSDLPGYTKMVVFNNDPAGAVTNYVRGVGQQSDLSKYYAHGEFSDIMFAAKMRWDVDCFQKRTDRILHIAPDMDFGQRSALLVGFCRLIVLSDGTVYIPVDNVAHLQLAHIASFPGAGTVDVSIDGRVVASGLPAGSATAFVDVPSGLREATAPEIRIEVRASEVGSENPLLTLEQKFLFGHRYLSVLADNPKDETGASPVGLFLTDLGTDSTLQQNVGVTVFNGTASTRSITLGSGEPAIMPLTDRILFGAFETGVPLPSVDTTVVVMDGDDRSLLASFELDLAEKGLADSSFVLVTSTAPSAAQRRSSSSGMALMAALPSGGELVSFEGSSPPPWWQKPWLLLLLVAGAVGVAFVGSQVRVRRLETRSKELERTVQERTQELRAEKEKTEEQARRLVELDETKNRFFANISHEFRTPLTLILGPLQDALDGLYQDDPEGLAKQHRLMHRSARRLLRLINQLLDLSRLESGKMNLQPEPGDLVDFARGIYRSFVPLAERRRITLDFLPDVEVLPARYDPDALEKVLSNLISNALKFTPEDGAVEIVLGTAKVEGVSQCAIAVKDSGAGIDPADLERIFDRFQQVDTSIRRRFEGSGIGLSLARELTELHGGTLLVDSELGQGSSFTVRIPLADEPAPPREDGQVLRLARSEDLEETTLAIAVGDGTAARQTAEGDQPLILIVEDNPDVREYIRTHLESTYRVVEATDGEEGLATTRDQRPDLVLADVMMPNMDGYEMCRLIKANEELSHIPVVMLTAKAAEQDTVEGLQSGADDYLAKPFSVAELTARVSNLIQSRRELEERFSREVFVRPADIEITPEGEVFLDHLLDAINAHLGDANLTIEWLAEEMGLSRRQLERRVEAVAGQPPAALVRRFRLERASQLLRARAGTVSEISYAVGFRSPAHFAKAFRQAFGESPSEHILRRAQSEEA